jgi:serine/threonine-protein kinase
VEGRTLGSYKVLERLGAGGQGHVYRAIDTTLEREIAIKVLPAVFVTDPARLKQFQQEAKLLAAASHPNIAAVYGIEQFEEVHFFTQELVPGKALDAILKERGPLGLDDTLEICRQIAAALEMAHERRLVHRDLKPANVMVKPDGGVKVLDFGLALPVDREDDDEQYGISDSMPTISRTADAVIVGTAPYMSPDQARGRMVDHRTDIWAFGCILYECLTGKRPFEGETLLDTLSAIVRMEPDLDLLPPSTPSRMRYLIRRCLKKRLGDRLQHIGDARIVLEEIQADPLPGPEVGAAVGAAAPAGKSVWAIAAAAAIAGTLLGAALWAWMQPASTSRQALRTVMMMTPARLDVDRSSAIALAPNGGAVVYAGNLDGESQIYRRALNSFEATPIAGTAGGENPFFSPDGSWVGFFSDGLQLVRVPVAGGVAVVICDVRVGNWGATWLPDDTIVYGTYSTGLGLMRVATTGGEPVEITTLDIDGGETNHGWPHPLPGGTSLLFTVSTTVGTSIAVLDLQTGARHVVVENASDARYIEPGYLTFAQQGTLFAVPFDLNTRQAVGTPQPVIDDMFTHNTANRVSYAVAPNGTLVYASGDTGARRDHFVWVDRQGNVEPVGIEEGNYGHPRLSPSGDRLAYDSFRDGRADIWVWDLTRQTPTRLSDEGENVMPVWSPDGSKVLFASSGHGAAGLFWHRADGAGEAHPTLVSEHSLWPLSWNNRAIAYYELNPETGRDIWVLGAGEGAQPTPFQRSRFNERSPVFSPDGRWIAYVSNASGRDEVYVKQFGESGSQHTISSGGGSEPVWSPDGRELFYRSGEWLIAVPIEVPDAGSDVFNAGTQQALFAGTFKSEYVAGNQYYDVAPDGQRFIMLVEDEALRGPDRLHMVMDFGRELEAQSQSDD